MHFSLPPRLIARIIVEIIAIVAIAEAAVMSVLPAILPEAEGVIEALADALLLSLLAGPMIAWRVTRWCQWYPHHTQSEVITTPTWKRIAPSAIVLIGGLVLTTLATLWMYEDVHEEGLVRFNNLADRAEREIARRMRRFVYGLNGLRGVFVASKSVERHEFLAYAHSRDLPREFPGALGQGFIQRVPREQLETFVTATRADDASDFAVKTSGDASDLFIIKFIEPLEANRPAWGYDIGSEPNRREAAERAMRTGEPAITRMIHLLQDHEERHGFLCFVPVYSSSKVPATPQERERACIGWTYMPITSEDALAGIDDSTDHELDVEVFDDVDLDMAKLAYDSDNHLQGKTDAELHTAYAGRTYRKDLDLPIHGRVWKIRLSSHAAFDRTIDIARPGAVAAVGGVLTLLLAGFVWNLSSARTRALQLAQLMTKDLELAKLQAEDASRSKSEFLANMSHEIRTPMTAILGFADLLDEFGNRDAAPRERLEYIATIRRNGVHLLSIINDILDLSKIEAGKMTVEAVPTEINGIVHDVLSLMAVKATAKQLKLAAEFATRIPQQVYSDPVRLRQILMNLVGNAIKFTERGGVKLIVSHGSDKVGSLQFAVVDTGIGLRPDQIERLFGTFAQADASTTRKFGGTGLGLHISKRLAQMLGGDITVSSVPGAGSTFTVTIKAEICEGASALLEPGPAQVVADQPPHANADSKSSLAQPLVGVRILLAEDGPDNVRLIALYLRKAGAEVRVAENGKLAVEHLSVAGDVDGPLLDPSPVDLLLTDIQMPEMDGYTATRLLRAKGCTLPIVALTANAMSGDVDKCLSAGCDDYASKPIDRNTLIRTVLRNLKAVPGEALTDVGQGGSFFKDRNDVNLVEA